MTKEQFNKIKVGDLVLVKFKTQRLINTFGKGNLAVFVIQININEFSGRPRVWFLTDKNSSKKFQLLQYEAIKIL